MRTGEEKTIGGLADIEMWFLSTVNIIGHKFGMEIQVDIDKKTVSFSGGNEETELQCAMVLGELFERFQAAEEEEWKRFLIRDEAGGDDGMPRT